MVGDRATERAWLQTIWPIVAGAGWVLALALWYGGGLSTTVQTNTNLIHALQDDIARLRNDDVQQGRALAVAVEERNQRLQELERRIMDKSDQFNEKIASATATNQATRDMLMLLEHRLEAIESERRSK